MEVKQKQIEFLERFISGDMRVVEHIEHGLCSNLRAYAGKGVDYGLYCALVISWTENQQGSITCPVLGSWKRIPKYEGEQLRLRISLAKHLLEGLRDD